MKTNLKLKAISTLAIVFSLYTGCAPQSRDSVSTNSQVNTSSNSNIIGGQLATVDFQKKNGIVALYIVLKNTTGQTSGAICTGTLIARNIVLTAAHCVNAPSQSLRVLNISAIFATDINTAQKTDVIPALTYKANENFMSGIKSKKDSTTKIWNDVALIKLSQDAPADFNLALLPKSINEIILNASSSVILSGYGISTPILNQKVKDPATGKVSVQPINIKDDAGVLRYVEAIPVISVTPGSTEITLNQTNPVKGACHGDSGGPAFVKSSNGDLIQVGITSRGTDSLGNCNQFAIYTDVEGQLDWINTNMMALSK